MPVRRERETRIFDSLEICPSDASRNRPFFRRGANQRQNAIAIALTWILCQGTAMLLAYFLATLALHYS